jgi:SpoIID/LytB domain protein
MDKPMLTPELIPKKEPMIRVGLILPEDNIKSIQFSFSDFQCFEIVPEDRHLPSFKNTASLNVNIVEGKLVIPEIDFCDASLKIIPSTSTEYPFITVDGIPAGRGFHWEKKISASYWGILELTIFDGQMMAVNELPLEQYLKCVSTSEMSAKCPPEFLKAQTIVARSWLLANIEQKHRNLGVDICNDDCCQRYQGMAHCTDASIKSADVTSGQVIMFDEKICDARYSKSCGGITENFDNVWEGKSIPYLVSVVDNDAKGTAFCSPEIVLEGSLKNYIGNVDEKGQYFRWEFEATQGELIQSLKNKQNVTATEIVQLIPEIIGYSGRIIVLRIEYKDFQNNLQSIEIHSEYEIRDIISPSFLFSSAFTIQKNEKGNFILHGKGWGHGVGLCQIGALGMAISGKSSEEILDHYYSVSKLQRIYSS